MDMSLMTEFRLWAPSTLKVLVESEKKGGRIHFELKGNQTYNLIVPQKKGGVISEFLAVHAKYSVSRNLYAFPSVDDLKKAVDTIARRYLA